MHLPDPIISALRDNDQERFATELAKLTSDQLAATNSIPFANWFSGVGLSLLQLSSFVRPKLAPLVLARGVHVDLHSACALGDVAKVKALLAEQTNATEAQVDSYYPIQFALGHPECLRCLLENGDNASRVIQKLAWFEWEDQATKLELSNWRPMHMVALGRGDQPHSESAQLLLDFGADPSAASSPFGEAPIHLSAIYNRTEMIRWFVSIGCDVDSRSVQGIDAEKTAELFDTKPFAPFTETYGKTPLMVAAGEGHAQATTTLLELGADTNAIDSQGFTSLHYAAGAFWQENVDIVRSLIERGSDPTAESANGLRPVDLAAKRGYSETQAVLQH